MATEQAPQPGNDNKKETRVFQIELRDLDLSVPEGAADGVKAESRTVVGYAAKFNTNSEDMGFIEIIEPGAFAEAIPNSDIRALFNHDPNIIFARANNGKGTLTVEEDSVGLRYQFDVPDTSFGNDFLVSLKRGDITQSSFSFSVKEQAWESVKLENGDYQYTRRIKKVERLYDVSPVTYPAYVDTEVAIRSLNTIKEIPPAGEPGWAEYIDALKTTL